MTAPTYLLAKFIPDLKRMEPRNIGVILWTEERVSARFLFERPNKLGEVNGQMVPNWIGNLNAYKQWIAYWRASVSHELYRSPAGGATISIASAEFIKAVQSANCGNYVLVEGGTLLNDIPSAEAEEACQYLFDTLVDDRQVEQTRDLTLDERWSLLIDSAHVKGNPLLRRDYPVVFGEETFIFSDALANGAPRRLFERVALANRQATFMKNAHHAAWQFEKVIQANILPIEATGAVLSMNEEQEHEHRGPLASLRSVTRVINLQRPEDVLSEVGAIEETMREEQRLHTLDATENPLIILEG